jgi:hypothetical protein
MQRFIINAPKRLTVTVQVEITYDSDQYDDDVIAAEEVRDIISNATQESWDEYLHIEDTTLLSYHKAK